MMGFGGARAETRRVLVLGAALGVFLGSTSALAEEPKRVASLTISPIHLVLPIVELTAEVSVVPALGIAAIGGVGSMAVESSNPELDGERFTVYEAGAQVLGYPLEPFESLVLGAEVLWLHIATDDSVGGSGISGTGQGVAVGPLIGYKYIASGGFTLFVHAGAQYITGHAQAEDETGTQQENEDDAFIPLINFNLGFSF